MFKIATSAAEGTSTADAAAQCIDHLLAQQMDAPHYLMVHADARHDLDALRIALQERWPQVSIHAATSCLGSMIETGTHIAREPGLCILAIADATGDYGTACGPIGESPRATAAELVRMALAKAQRLGEKPAMVWMSGAPGCEEEILLGLQDVVGTATPIVGGSAADNAIEGKWQVMADASPIGNGLVVSVLFPSTRIGAAFHSGYQPTEKRGRITRGSGRRVFEIDGQPAADVYAAWTQGAVTRPSSGSVNVLMESSLWPLGRQVDQIRGADIFKLSHPETLSADGSLTLFTDISVGDEFVLMQGTAESLLERPALVSDAACRMGGIDKEQVSGMILVFCAGCMLTVKDRLDEVRRSLNACLPGVPFIAAFTFGEQGPALASHNAHGNLMISAVIFARDGSSP